MMSSSGKSKSKQQKLVQTTLACFRSASGQSSSQDKGVKRKSDNLEMSCNPRKKNKQNMLSAPQSNESSKSQSAVAVRSKDKKETDSRASSQHSDKTAGLKDGTAPSQSLEDGTAPSQSLEDGTAPFQSLEDGSNSERSLRKEAENEDHDPKNMNSTKQDSKSQSRSRSDQEKVISHDKERESDSGDDTDKTGKESVRNKTMSKESSSDRYSDNDSEERLSGSLSSDRHNHDRENIESEVENQCARKAEPHKEVRKHDLKTAPYCLRNEKDWLCLSPSSNDHVICVEVPIAYNNDGPRPYPRKFDDWWNEQYVRMPCSKENLYPDPESGKNVARWILIERALKPRDKGFLECFIQDSFTLQNAILTYNKHNENKWNFTILHKYFDEYEDEKKDFFNNLLPKMCRLALKLPHLCTKPIPLLRKGTQKRITLSQQQIACLLANAFFCTFPRRNSRSRFAEYSNYPDINFNNLFQKGNRAENGKNVINRKLQKLKCLLNYFKRVCNNTPQGLVTFTRQVRPTKQDWAKCTETFTDLFVSPHGTIEDDGVGMLQVDFANKYIGGGALNTGLVQEEIRFMICPEMIVSRLFTESLSDNECLIMTGCEQFSRYSGYADSFTFLEDFKDKTERDSNGRLYCEVVAIDALVFKDNPRAQYKSFNVDRELNKAYCGFFTHELSGERPAVCTGNWGCGAFGGDKQLKSLIQLMAAAVTKRQVSYLTFQDNDLSENLSKVHKLLTDKKKTVGDVYKLISGYNREVVLRGYQRMTLFDYIFDKLGDFSSLGDQPSYSDDERSREELENSDHVPSDYSSDHNS